MNLLSHIKPSKKAKRLADLLTKIVLVAFLGLGFILPEAAPVWLRVLLIHGTLFSALFFEDDIDRWVSLRGPRPQVAHLHSPFVPC
jgi:hypothetical protein